MKKDVWDFSATEVEGEYNNLTVDKINAFYGEDVAPGSVGVDIGTFDLYDHEGELVIKFVSDKDNNRIRTSNELITRTDNNGVKKGVPGQVYQGVIYSNSHALIDTRFEIYMREGEIFEFLLGSNGNEATYILLDEKDREVKRFNYTNTYGVELAGFSVGVDGWYKLYCSDEKLVCARIIRIPALLKKHSGAIFYDREPNNDYDIVFKNISYGKEYRIHLSSDSSSYEADLYEGFDYDVKFDGELGFVVSRDGDALRLHHLELDKLYGNVNIDQIPKNFAIKAVSREERLYKPEVFLSGSRYEVSLEHGIIYTLEFQGVNDYDIVKGARSVCLSEDYALDYTFAPKKLYNVIWSFVYDEEVPDFTLEFLHLGDNSVYTFAAGSDIKLRNGRYRVRAIGLEPYSLMMKPCRDVVIEGSDCYVDFELTRRLFFNYVGKISNPAIVPALKKWDTVKCIYQSGFSYEFVTEEDGDCQIMYRGEDVTVRIIPIKDRISYRSELNVGPDKEFKKISDAIDCARKMIREDKRVVINIDPGDYEEIFIVDTPNITLRNSSRHPAIGTCNQGIGIVPEAVRITWYYGHGYNYYSMNEEGLFDEELLKVNLANDHTPYENPGAGWTSLWNATVRVMAPGFEAENIIFENSFNQYMSKASKRDKIITLGGAREGAIPRCDISEFDTMVSNKEYVERAACMALNDGVGKVIFKKCAFISRQDTLYGGENVMGIFDRCVIMGNVDYIFGGMKALFYRCDLKFNTSDRTKKGVLNERVYICAPRQASGRGYLFHSCNISSAIPGVENDSILGARVGYFGRPWRGKTAEAVFYKTIIGTCHKDLGGRSLVSPVGAIDTLGGKSELFAEYATVELSGEDNTSERVDWMTCHKEDDFDVNAFLGGSLEEYVDVDNE